jgi:hypothetical protein
VICGGSTLASSVARPIRNEITHHPPLCHSWGETDPRGSRVRSRASRPIGTSRTISETMRRCRPRPAAVLRSQLSSELRSTASTWLCVHRAASAFPWLACDASGSLLPGIPVRSRDAQWWPPTLLAQRRTIDATHAFTRSIRPSDVRSLTGGGPAGEN